MIFEVTLEQEFAGQTLINRWNYESQSTPSAVSLSFGLAAAMGFIIPQPSNDPPAGTIMEALTLFQAVSLTYVQATVRAVYDVVDFYSTPFVPELTGTITQPGESPMLAYGFRTNRVRQDIDRGTKRFGGVPISSLAANGEMESGTLAFMAEVASRMSANITYDDEGTTLTYAPIVVKKQKYTTPNNTTAYRYYPTLAEQELNVARSIIWSPYTTIRSQTSRQYGRGK